MRQWRVGTISMGLLLIFFGALLLGDTVFDINVGELLVYGWPIILILIGVEVLLFSYFKKDGRLKFDFFSIFILFMAIMFTFVIYSVQETGILSAVKNAVYDKGYTFDINEELQITDDIKEIVIEAPNGDFDITGTDSDQAKVTGTIRLSAVNEEEAREYLEDVFTVKKVGSQVIIRVEQVNKLNWIGNHTLEANLAISIPKKQYVEAHLINGDMDINNMEGSGKIEGVNGRISLRDIKGDYNVDTVNGELTFHNLLGKLEADTVNGEILVTEIDGELNLDTTNGEIEVTSNTVNDWELSTTNGDITIEIPKSIDARIIADSTIGDVDGNVSWDKVDNDDKKLGSRKETTLGDGQYLIDLSNQHGEIEVNIR